jgi:hypothetical protein
MTVAQSVYFACGQKPRSLVLYEILSKKNAVQNLKIDYALINFNITSRSDKAAQDMN